MKKKSEENTSKKSKTLYREEVKIKSICNDHEEEYKDYATNYSKKLNARKNKKEKNKLSEHLTHYKNDRQC
jgi:hypothetical protein